MKAAMIAAELAAAGAVDDGSTVCAHTGHVVYCLCLYIPTTGTKYMYQVQQWYRTSISSLMRHSLAKHAKWLN